MSAETRRGANPTAGADDAALPAGPESPASAEGFFLADGDRLLPAAFATSPNVVKFLEMASIPMEFWPA